MERKKLALIHIIKKELGLEDAEYRTLLREAAGVESSRDLDEAGFRRLMRHFIRTRHYRVTSDGVTLRQKMFIKSLADALGWTPEHLSNFLHKYHHKDSLDRLTRKEASRVIESLKHVREHEQTRGL